MRSLGLDIGDRWIGVALSVPGGMLASPHAIVDRQDERLAIETIIDIIGRYQVGQVVVGLPRSMDGSLGRQAGKVTDFIEQLRSRTDVPMDFRDERLTTTSAKRLLHDVNARKNRKTRRRVRDDAAAAAIILQGYLDEGHKA